MENEEFKNTLKKYIKHVFQCEGSDFIGIFNWGDSDVYFTEWEKKILQKFSEENGNQL